MPWWLARTSVAAKQALEVPPVWDSCYNLLNWILGSLLVYMVLFEVGKLLPGEKAVGAVFLAISALSAYAIYWNFPRRSWEILSDKKVS